MLQIYEIDWSYRKYLVLLIDINRNFLIEDFVQDFLDIK